MCMIEARLNCVIYSTHVSNHVLLDGGNAPIIGFIRFLLKNFLRKYKQRNMFNLGALQIPLPSLLFALYIFKHLDYC